MARPDYGPFVAAARSMVDPAKSARLVHVPFRPFPPSAAILAPLCQIIQVYLEAEQNSEALENVTNAFQQYVETLNSGQVHGFTGESTYGWALETVEVGGQNVKVFVALLGWNSLATCRAAQQFRLSGAQDTEMVHVEFSSPVY